MCSTCVNNETTCTPMLTELLLRAGMSHVVGAVERPVLLSHRAEFPPVHHLSFCPCCWMLMLFFLCCLSCCAAAAYYHTPSHETMQQATFWSRQILWLCFEPGTARFALALLCT